ncbi:hypothetical protein niasHS_006675 [Heterodera schachtii]|uniref:Uncharacterized protein n=1 Tax=Heterodera schachtii TaxID=97005 RepID=A0ABD2JHY2_HETSC
MGGRGGRGGIGDGDDFDGAALATTAPSVSLITQCSTLDFTTQLLHSSAAAALVEDELTGPIGEGMGQRMSPQRGGDFAFPCGGDIPSAPNWPLKLMIV